MKNKKIKKYLICGSALLGLMGIGYVSGQLTYQTVNAESGTLYVPHNASWAYARDTSIMSWVGPWTINGKTVWCIEPKIGTEGGSSYSTGGSYKTGYVSQGHRVVGNSYEATSLYLPYVFYNMSTADLQELFGARGLAVIQDFRKYDASTKWSVMQMMIWKHTGSGTAYSSLIAGAGADQIVANVNAMMNAFSGDYDDIRTLLGQGFQNGKITVVSDASVMYSGSLQKTVMADGSLQIVREGYLKATKEFSNLTQDLNTKPSWDPNGIKVGVYKSSDASGQQVGILTIGANGHSNTLKVKPDKYYGFELDVNGNPIKSVASEVVNGTAANRGYVSGSDKKDTSKPYIVWDVKAENTESNPDVQTFVNTPEVVNFTFSKEIAADSIKSLEAIDPQYTRVGAVYTLYKDAGATQPVTRNGQNVTATIGADGTAEFSNLYRGVYYVKETAVPTFVKNGRTVKRFALDKKVYTVDLSTMNDNETNTSDSTFTATKEFKQVGSFVSLEDVLPSSGSLVIKKKDADTKSNTAQGQATLQGAEFKVEFYEMTTLGTNAPVKKWETVYKTDANGEIDVRNRNLMVSTTNADAMNKLFTAYEQAKEWGAYDYRVTETKAPNGYKLGTPQTKDFVVNVKADFSWAYDDASIYNDDLEIHLIKTQRSSGDWLPEAEAKKVVIKDATFELTNKTTGQKFTATSDANGKLQYDGVIAGDYTLKETGAKKYKTNGQTIDIRVAQQDGTTKLVASSQSVPTEDNGAFNVTEMLDKDILVEFENTAIDAKAKLIKANEKGERLDGAVFKVTHYNEDGTRQIGEAKEITTNDKGELEFAELKIGHWYTVEEIKAPKGYKLPAKRTVLRFRAEAIPAKDSYAISYWTSTLDKTNENNTQSVTSSIKKISTEGTVQDGIKFDADEAKGTMAIEFDFVNNTWKQLPATGSNFGMIVGVVAFAIVIGSTVFYVKRREA